MIALAPPIVALLEGAHAGIRLDYVMEATGVLRGKGKYIAKIVRGTDWATGLGETPAAAVLNATTSPSETGVVKHD